MAHRIFLKADLSMATLGRPWAVQFSRKNSATDLSVSSWVSFSSLLMLWSVKDFEPVLLGEFSWFVLNILQSKSDLENAVMQQKISAIHLKTKDFIKPKHHVWFVVFCNDHEYDIYILLAGGMWELPTTISRYFVCFSKKEERVIGGIKPV